MNVTLPNGMTISGIPEGTPKEAIMAKAIQSGLATESDFGITQPQEAPVNEPINTNTPNVAMGEPSAGGLIDNALSVAEPALAMGSGMIAEPIAGVAGVIQSVNPFADEGAGAEAVGDVRESLTYTPKTEAGQSGMEAVGEFVEPVAEALSGAESYLGDKAFDITGSPTVAAAAKTFPTAIMELIGVAGFRGGLKASKGESLPSNGRIAREISDAAPTAQQLKDVSREVYKEIDNLGVTLQPKAYKGMANKLRIEANKMGLDPDITPKANKAVKRFAERVGDDVSLTEIDTLRKVAGNAAKATEPADAAIGSVMTNIIDDFLDSLSPSAFKGDAGDIGKRYKVARDLWGRSMRSKLLDESFSKARLQASGFENGIRTQFRSILNNKKQRKMFKPDELKAMKNVVMGSKKENLAKLIGRLGFSEGSATNIIGGSIGVGIGAQLFGPAGAVAIPLIGQVSRKLAQRMTAKGAEFADEVIRAGKDAKQITQAYLRNTPKDQISSSELSQLLMRNDIDLGAEAALTSKIGKEASKMAKKNRAALAASLAVGSENEQPPVN
jgi:hypothetical protein